MSPAFCPSNQLRPEGLLPVKNMEPELPGPFQMRGLGDGGPAAGIAASPGRQYAPVPEADVTHQGKAVCPPNLQEAGCPALARKEQLCYNKKQLCGQVMRPFVL